MPSARFLHKNGGCRQLVRKTPGTATDSSKLRLFISQVFDSFPPEHSRHYMYAQFIIQADAVVVCLDLTDIYALQRAKFWFREFVHHKRAARKDIVPFVLVGMKCDLGAERVVYMIRYVIIHVLRGFVSLSNEYVLMFAFTSLIDLLTLPSRSSRVNQPSNCVLN